MYHTQQNLQRHGGWGLPAAALGCSIDRLLGIAERPATTRVLWRRGGVELELREGRTEPPWRQNYSLAHEVFHLVTWDATVGPLSDGKDEPEWIEHIERLAKAFASHLLLPAEEVETQFDVVFPGGDVTHPELVEMAREFEVSTEALVWRLRLMGRLSQSQAEEILAAPELRRLDRRSMVGRWEEPPTDPLPDRYWRLALAAYERGEVTLSKLARMLERPVSETGALLMDAGDEPEASAATA